MYWGNVCVILFLTPSFVLMALDQPRVCCHVVPSCEYSFTASLRPEENNQSGFDSGRPQLSVCVCVCVPEREKERESITWPLFCSSCILQNFLSLIHPPTHMRTHTSAHTPWGINSCANCAEYLLKGLCLSERENWQKMAPNKLNSKTLATPTRYFTKFPHSP